MDVFAPSMSRLPLTQRHVDVRQGLLEPVRVHERVHFDLFAEIICCKITNTGRDASFTDFSLSRRVLTASEVECSLIATLGPRERNI